MEEFKGTPGKWGFCHNSASDSSTACIEITSTESVHEVARLQSTERKISRYYEPTSFDRTIANAQLISAAPELLEGLQLMVSAQVLPVYYETIAKAAIAKALGK